MPARPTPNCASVLINNEGADSACSKVVSNADGCIKDAAGESVKLNVWGVVIYFLDCRELEDKD